MNAKMCKKLRKTLLKNGYVKVEVELSFVHYKGENTGIPLTYKYPMDSFQRAYRNIKKSCKRGY